MVASEAEAPIATESFETGDVSKRIASNNTYSHAPRFTEVDCEIVHDTLLKVGVIAEQSRVPPPSIIIGEDFGIAFSGDSRVATT